MPPSHRATRRIEFADTDAAGIVHFSAYFRLMEQAEHEFLRHLGLSVLLSDEEGPISFPRVRATCEYHSALRFEDEVAIEVTIDRLGEKSIQYRFEFYRNEVVVAEGEITVVCCRVGVHGAPRPIPIPDWIAARLSAP